MQAWKTMHQGYMPALLTRHEVMLTGYWPGRDRVTVHMYTHKKESGQYPAILTKQASKVNKGFIIHTYEWLQGIFLAGHSMQSTATRQHHVTKPGNQSHCRIWFILHTHRASHIIKLQYLVYSSWRSAGSGG